MFVEGNTHTQVQTEADTLCELTRFTW